MVTNWVLDDPHQLTYFTNQSGQINTADTSAGESALTFWTKSGRLLNSFITIPSTIVVLSGVIFVRMQNMNK